MSGTDGMHLGLVRIGRKAFEKMCRLPAGCSIVGLHAQPGMGVTVTVLGPQNGGLTPVRPGDILPEYEVVYGPGSNDVRLVPTRATGPAVPADRMLYSEFHDPTGWPGVDLTGGPAVEAGAGRD